MLYNQINNKFKAKYKALVLNIQLSTHITNHVHPDIPPSLPHPTSPLVKMPPYHSRALALQILTQEPLLIHSTVHFENAYYALPPEDDISTEINVNLPHNQYQSAIIARNLHHGNVIRSITKLVVNSGANRHMCNARRLFINLIPYTGIKLFVTLGEGKN